MIKTRFAPSPTGFLHIGGARTALFAYAYAKHMQGEFYLRIEDTDLERSTQNSVNSIIDAMEWLDLERNNSEIYYQTKHMLRYQQVIQQLLDNGHAYHCYCSKDELEQMREQQKASGLKPRYDRRCLHNKTVKPGVQPVVRFKNPDFGSVIWHDLVKGKIEVQNSELDDLIIARSSGTPTYNLCVVVDDLDMQITHVIRGDDHVNNTPRQINILAALNAPIPQYAHVPMILREDGQKMSKRTDAVSVMQYEEMGILPQALLNYLSRLCWGHGNDEIFTLDQFITWFNLDNISSSPARFDLQKLYWVNAEHIKLTDNKHLAQLVLHKWQQLSTKSGELHQHTYHNASTIHQHSKMNLEEIIALIKARANTINLLAYECAYLYSPLPIATDDHNTYLTTEANDILTAFKNKLAQLETFDLVNIKAAIKEFCKEYDIKMPQLGMPLRLKLCGTTKTAAFDSILELLGKDEVLKRLNG